MAMTRQDCCSFCGKHAEEIKVLLEGPNAFRICDECASLCWELILDKDKQRGTPPMGDSPSETPLMEPEEARRLLRTPPVTSAPEGEPACSFCGKVHLDTVILIAGPGVNICDACVRLCISAAGLPVPMPRPGFYLLPADSHEATCSFCSRKSDEAAMITNGHNWPVICSDCLAAMAGLMGYELHPRPTPGGPSPLPASE